MTDPSPSDGTIYFDIETNGLIEVDIEKKKGVLYATSECDRIWCISLAEGDGPTESYTGDQIPAGIERLLSAKRLIGHNILAFDVRYLERVFPDPRWAQLDYLDTIVVSRMLFPEIQNTPIGGHSLKAWGRFVGEFKQDWKDAVVQASPKPWLSLTKMWAKLDPFSGPPGWMSDAEYLQVMVDYCEQDVRVTRKIHQALNASKQMRQRLTPRSIALEMRTGRILAQQVETGFAFDVRGGERLDQKWQIRMAEIQDELQRVWPPKPRFSTKTGKRLKHDDVFNPGSNQQIAARLIETYGWEPEEYTPSGDVKVDESILRALPYPEAKLIAEFKDLKKQQGMLSDWICRAENSRDGRIHGQVNQVGAGTSRMTHSEPNVTQVTKRPEVRTLWSPGDGYVQVGADLSGLELRLLAHYMAAYDNGSYADVVLNSDIHTHNMQMAGLETRDQAKGFIYALLYGAGDAKLGVQMGGVSAYKAKKARQTILETLPALARVIADRESMAEQHGHVQLLDGRWVPADQRRALNRTMQGSGSVIAKQWLINIYDNSRHLDVRFLANVHDEIQLGCPPEQAEELARIAEAASVQAGEMFGTRIPIHSEAKIGRNWWECH